jgi:hypothetical protein
MKSPSHTCLPGTPDRGSAEKTLRLLASLPAPQGLADRVHERLRVAPPPARILGWPRLMRPAGGWMHGNFARSAAAAAIVCVVAGGGWRIYSRVELAPANNVIVMPTRIAPEPRGFSSAGAARVPQTLDGPVLTHPVKEPPADVVQLPAPPRSVPAHKKKAAKTLIIQKQ